MMTYSYGMKPTHLQYFTESLNNDDNLNRLASGRRKGKQHKNSGVESFVLIQSLFYSFLIKK